MGVLVWAMTGIAIWHFAVFVPDRFWGGIVGAFGAAVLGALLFGMMVHLAGGGDIDTTGIGTMVEAAAGAAIALALSWFVGARRGEQPMQH